jgi:hypothetical protein
MYFHLINIKKDNSGSKIGGSKKNINNSLK